MCSVEQKCQLIGAANKKHKILIDCIKEIKEINNLLTFFPQFDV